VRDADGKPAKLSQFAILAGIWRPLQATLKGGEEFEMGSLQLALEEAGGKDAGKPTLCASPGKYRVSYAGLPSNLSDTAKFLSTGGIEFEVKAKGDLQGSWKATSFEQDGRAWPEEKAKEIEVKFSGDGHRFTSGLRVAGAESGTFSSDPKAKPKSFDLMPKEGVFKKEVFTGIYKGRWGHADPLLPVAHQGAAQGVRLAAQLVGRAGRVQAAEAVSGGPEVVGPLPAHQFALNFVRRPRRLFR
jgi:uncharacterized protein (TIGR03067 family)